MTTATMSNGTVGMTSTEQVERDAAILAASGVLEGQEAAETAADVGPAVDEAVKTETAAAPVEDTAFDTLLAECKAGFKRDITKANESNYDAYAGCVEYIRLWLQAGKGGRSAAIQVLAEDLQTLSPESADQSETKGQARWRGRIQDALPGIHALTVLSIPFRTKRGSLPWGYVLQLGKLVIRTAQTDDCDTWMAVSTADRAKLDALVAKYGPKRGKLPALAELKADIKAILTPELVGPPASLASTPAATTGVTVTAGHDPKEGSTTKGGVSGPATVVKADPVADSSPANAAMVLKGMKPSEAAEYVVCLLRNSGAMDIVVLELLDALSGATGLLKVTQEGCVAAVAHITKPAVKPAPVQPFAAVAETVKPAA